MNCRICEALGWSVDEHVAEALRKLEERPQQLAEEKEYGRRLEICAQCKEKLPDGTCRMCGCYVVLRARLKTARCPYRDRWRTVQEVG